MRSLSICGDHHMSLSFHLRVVLSRAVRSANSFSSLNSFIWHTATRWPILQTRNYYFPVLFITLLLSLVVAGPESYAAYGLLILPWFKVRKRAGLLWTTSRILRFNASMGSGQLYQSTRYESYQDCIVRGASRIVYDSGAVRGGYS